MARGEAGILGGDADRAGRGLGRVGDGGHDQAAEADPEIERDEQVVLALEQDVAADDPEVGGAVLDVGRDVVGLEEEKPDAVGRVLADEPAIAAEQHVAVEPRSAQACRERLEDPAFRDGDDEGVRHQAWPGTRSMSAPSAASFSSMRS
jgi:hypothetical protein